MIYILWTKILLPISSTSRNCSRIERFWCQNESCNDWKKWRCWKLKKYQRPVLEMAVDIHRMLQTWTFELTLWKSGTILFWQEILPDTVFFLNYCHIIKSHWDPLKQITNSEGNKSFLFDNFSFRIQKSLRLKIVWTLPVIWISHDVIQHWEDKCVLWDFVSFYLDIW